MQVRYFFTYIPDCSTLRYHHEVFKVYFAIIQRRTQVKCAKLTGTGTLEIQETPEPQLAPGQILVAMKAVGICGSDIHYYTAGRIGSEQCRYPQTLGHECAGVVVKSFKGSKVREGTRVAIEPALPCMKCEICITGHYNCCPNVKFLGSPGMPGAFQELLPVDVMQVEEIPDDMSFDEAAVLEPLGVAYHTVELAGIQPGQSVAVFGAGAIGLLTLAMFKVCGAGETFIFDTLQYRLDIARRLYKADHVINVNGTDPLEYIRTMTKGRGVDITCEAAGQPQTFQWSFEAARIRGAAYIIGIPGVDSISFNPHTMRRKELLIRNVRRSNLALKPCIDLVDRGMLRIGELATHHFTLDRIKDAFDLASGYRDGAVRAIITA